MLSKTFLENFSYACVLAPVGTVYQNLTNIAWGPLIIHYPWCGVLVLIPASLICHGFLLYHLGCSSLFCSWVMWLRYYWHHSGRPPRFNYFLCIIALEVVQLGQKSFQMVQIDGGVLHLRSLLPWWINLSPLKMVMNLVVSSVGPGALWLLSLIMGDTLILVSLWVLLMLRRIHP